MASVPNMRLAPTVRPGVAEQPGDGAQGEDFAQLLSTTVAVPDQAEGETEAGTEGEAEARAATGQAEAPIAQANAILSLVAPPATTPATTPPPTGLVTVTDPGTTTPAAANGAGASPVAATDGLTINSPTSPAPIPVLAQAQAGTATPNGDPAATSETGMPAPDGTNPAAAPEAHPELSSRTGRSFVAGGSQSAAPVPANAAAPTAAAPAAAAAPATSLAAELARTLVAPTAAPNSAPASGSRLRSEGAAIRPGGNAATTDSLLASADAATQAPGAPAAGRGQAAAPALPTGDVTQPIAPAPASTQAPVPAFAPTPMAEPAAPAISAAGPLVDMAAPEQIIERHLDLAADSEWLDQLAKDIATAGDSEGRLRFRLDPEHLGGLRVELSQSERGTSVRLLVESEAARQILADAQPKLAAEARAQGVRLAETQIDFAGGHAGDPRRHETARRDPQLRTVGDASTPTEPGSPQRASSDRYA